MLDALALLAALTLGPAGAQPVTTSRDQQLLPFADAKAARAALYSVQPDLKLLEPAPKELQPLVDRIDAAYRELYPAVMRRKAKPAAFAKTGRSMADAFTRTVQEVPGESYFGLLAVPSELLTEPGAEASVAGVIAHQLAHLYFNQEDSFRVISAWRATAPPSPLDATDLDALTRYVDNARLIGTSDTLFEGLPLGGGLLHMTFRELFGALVYDGRACAHETLHQLTSIQNSLRAHWSNYRGTYLFASSLEEEGMRRRLRAFREDTLACAEDAKELRRGFERLLDIGRSLHEALRAEFNRGLENVRWYSIEDEADEYAVTVMNHMGLPATDFSRQVLIETEKLDWGSLAQCDRAIRDKHEVPFGEIGNPRHTPCYRYQQVTRFANRTIAP